MRCDFYEPLWLDFDHLAHELLGGKGEFKVQQPLGGLLEERGGRVDADGLALLDGAPGEVQVLGHDAAVMLDEDVMAVG